MMFNAVVHAFFIGIIYIKSIKKSVHVRCMTQHPCLRDIDLPGSNTSKVSWHLSDKGIGSLASRKVIMAGG